MPTINATIRFFFRLSITMTQAFAVSQLMLLGLFTCILFAMRKSGLIAAMAPIFNEQPDVMIARRRCCVLAG
jgi:hypothetical protein